MVRLLALPLVVAAFGASIHPLTAGERAALNGRFWRAGCPVGLSQLRVLTVSYWGFDKRAHTGELVVNRKAAAPLARVFRQLYSLHFPIRHLSFADAYGPTQPADGDISGSFECRKAVPSPCGSGPGPGNTQDYMHFSWNGHYERETARRVALSVPSSHRSDSVAQDDPFL